MRFRLLIISLCISGFACTNKLDEGQTLSVTLNDLADNIYVEFETKELVRIPVTFDNPEISSFDLVQGDIKYIPLETSSESLVGEVSQLEVTDSHFVVLDKKSKSVVVFDHNGRFVNRIKRIGGGPEEYMIPKSIGYNQFLRTIDVFDNARRIIQSYDLLTGAYRYTIDVGFSAKAFSQISEKQYVFVIDSYLFNEERYAQVQGLAKQFVVGQKVEGQINIVSQHVDYIPKTGFLNFGVNQVLRKGSDGDLLFNTTFNDTIYSFSDNGITSKYLVDFGENAVGQDFFKESSLRDIEKRNQESRLPTPSVFWETQNHIYTTSAFLTEITHTFFEKSTGRALNVQKSDFMQAAGALGYWPIGVNDTSFIYSVEPDQIIDTRKNLLNHVRKIYPNSTEKDFKVMLDTFYIPKQELGFIGLVDKGLMAGDNPVLAFVQPDFENSHNR